MINRKTAPLMLAAVILLGAGLFLATWLTLASAVHAVAGTLYAAPASTGAGDCSGWTDVCTLQTALTNAGSGDEVWVRMGVHLPTTTTVRTISFTLKSGVALYGGSDREYHGAKWRYRRQRPRGS